MKRIPLDEWDKKVAPLLGAISIRAGQVLSDVKQIREWVDKLPAIPNFESTAWSAMNSIREAFLEINTAIQRYEGKDKVS